MFVLNQPSQKQNKQLFNTSQQIGLIFFINVLR